MKKTIEERFNEAVNYYDKSPKKRCRTHVGCYYSGDTIGKNTKGCMIGQFMTPKNRIEADSYRGGVGILISRHSELFPKWMLGLDVDMLRDFQELHDYESYWSDNGISTKGIDSLMQICEDYNLDPTKFDVLNRG